MEELVEFLEAEKSLAVLPHWEPVDNQFRLVAPLDIRGVTQEGYWFRGQCTKNYPDQHMTFQLERLFAFGRGPFIRLDWRPVSPHSNRNHGPESLRLLTIDGTHLHPLSANLMLGLKEMVQDNLPFAEPVDPDPESVAELLLSVQACFNVVNATGIQTPPWEPELF